MNTESNEPWRLVMLFVLGIGALVLGWIYAASVFEKVIDTLAGVSCLILVFVKTVIPRLAREEKTDEEAIPVEVEHNR